jgi:RimJ/RimL family protein N-acetyltransferase
VTATLSANGKPFSEDQTRGFLDRSAEHWNRYGFGLWLVQMRERNDFVGYAGIRHTIVENADEAELAYAMRPEYWRKGFATEMSNAALKYGFETLHLEKIVAFTLPHNLASRSVMEKCGFIYQRDIVHAGLPHVLYSIDSRTFAARPRP